VTTAESVTRRPSPVTQKAIGLLGGTFDPIHIGHLRLAEEVGEAFGLDAVRVMPAGTPPHRAAPVASAEHRRAMVELAIAGNPRLRLEAIELAKTEACYMVDTLAELRLELGETVAILLIVGADAFAGLESWRDWRRLFDLCHFVVAHRPGYAAWERRLTGALAGEYARRHRDDATLLKTVPAGYIARRAITPLDISASRLRADLGAGRSVRYLLPDPVLDYLERHRLYR
jgi:nicotinate-nucleotide adenylyltransferase